MTTKKTKKSDFYKNKKVFQIDNIDANKILVYKEKNRMVHIIYLNTLLDTMVMMLLDGYVQNFHKWLAMLKNLNLI